MARQDGVLELYESALAAIDDGDLGGARRLFATLEKLAPEDAKTHLLAGEIASMEDRPEDAVACFERAVAADPEWPIAILATAREELEGLEDPEAALRRVTPLLSHEDLSIRAEALFEAARAEIMGEKDRAALRHLRALADLPLAELEVGAGLFVDSGELALTIEDAALAERFYRTVLARDPEHADALHGLGFVLRETDRRDEMKKVWLRVRALDLAEPRAFTISEKEIDRIAHETLRALPSELRDRLADVPVLLEDAPGEARISDGTDPRLLGLFEGTPLGEKSLLGGSPHVPDAAYLFVRNLELACGSEDELREEVRITILHETAHFFGLEDEDLEELGLG